MAVIRDVDGNTWAVDSSKAARVTAYNSAGVTLDPDTPNIYSLSIGVRFSASLAFSATAFVWAMTAGEQLARRVRIRRLFLRTCYDGTESANSGQVQWVTFSGAVPSGGTSLLPVQGFRTGQAASSQIVDARVCSGAALLTTTDCIPEAGGHFAALNFPARNVSNGELDMDCVEMYRPYLFELSPGQGLALRFNGGTTNTIAGYGLAGGVSWEEA